MKNQNKKIIIEKRFNIFDKIKSYVRPVGQVEYFIHFTEVEGKLGINPMSDFNTPIGVYGYPLTPEIYDQFVNNRIPFASDRKFISIGKIDSKGREIISFGDDSPGNYSEKDLNEDVLKLYSIFLKTYQKEKQEILGSHYKATLRIFDRVNNLMKDVHSLREALHVNDTNVILYTLETLNSEYWNLYQKSLRSIAKELMRIQNDYFYDTGEPHPIIKNDFINKLYDFCDIFREVPKKIAQIKVDYVTSRSKEELENLDVDSIDEILLPQILPLAKSAIDSLYKNILDTSKILSYELQADKDPINLYEKFKENAFKSANKNTPVSKFWNLTRILSKQYAEVSNTKPLIAWTKILMKLGYGGFIDYETGTIHESEPTQLVLFPGNYEFVEQLKNVDRRQKETEKLKLISYIFRNIDNKSDFNSIKNILIKIPPGMEGPVVDVLRNSTSALNKMPDGYISMLISLINEKNNNNSIIFALNIILYALKNNSLSENQNKNIYEQLKDFNTNHYTIDKLIKSILIQINQKVDSLNSNIFDDLIKYDERGEGDLIEKASDFRYITSQELIRKVIFEDGHDFSNSTKAVLLSSVKFTDKDFLIEILNFLKNRKLIELLLRENLDLITRDQDLSLSVIKLLDEKGLFQLVDIFNLIKFPLSNELLKFFEDSMIESYKNKSSVESISHIGKLLSIIAGESEIKEFKFSDDLIDILLKNLFISNIAKNIVRLSNPATNSVFDDNFIKDFSIKILDSQDIPAKNIFLLNSLNSLINYSFNNKLDQEYLDIFMATLYQMDVKANRAKYLWDGILHSKQLLKEIIDNDGKYQIPQKKWDQIMINILSELDSGSLGIKMTLDDIKKIMKKTDNDKVKNYAKTFKVFLKENYSTEFLLEKFVKLTINNHI